MEGLPGEGVRRGGEDIVIGCLQARWEFYHILHKTNTKNNFKDIHVNCLEEHKSIIEFVKMKGQSVVTL